MTVQAHTTPELLALEPAARAADLSSPAGAGCLVGGAVGGDVIIISHRALAIIRAGLMVRALVIHGLESMRRTVSLGAHMVLCLENGIYQLA